MMEIDKTRGLSSEALKILEALPVDGRSIGNTSLSRKLGMAKNDFLLHRNQLIARGLVRASKGRGGGSRLLVISATTSDAKELVETLCPWSSKQARTAAKQRQLVEGKSDVDFENKLWRLMYRLKPAFITTGRDPKLAVEAKVSRPDAVAFFDGWGAIIECKYSDDEAFHIDGLEDLRLIRDAVKGRLHRDFGLDRVVLFLAVRDLGKVSPKVERRAQELRISLLDERRVEYFLRLEKETGLGMWDMFRGQTFPWLISHDKVELPALRMKVGKGRTAYLFTANAHDLRVRAFVSHREIHMEGDGTKGYPGYQRMLKRSRLSRIADYIRKYETFPTPIVVAFEESAGERFDLAPMKGENESIRFGTLHLPRKSASIQVIDGQHRLYGYTRVPPNPSHIIHVIAYKKPMAKDPAEMFVEINSEQKPVPQNLLWELYPDIYEVGHPKFHKAIISSAVEQLIGGKQMKGLVKHISSGGKGPITFQSICSEMEGILISKEGGLVGLISGDDPSRKEQQLAENRE